MIQFRLLISILIIGSIAACEIFNKKSNKDIEGLAVARVYDAYLLKEDIPSINDFNSKEDSIQITNRFINGWIKDEVVLSYAQKYVSDVTVTEIDREINEYKKELLINKYETELINQKFERIIDDEELISYYNKYMQSYKVDEAAVRFKYVKISVDDKHDSLKVWVKEEEHLNKLKDYCSEYLKECHLDTSSWVPFDYLLEKLKEDEVKVPLYLGKGTFAKTKGNKNVVYLKVIDKVEAEDYAPFGFVKDEIEEVLINKKRKDFLKEKRDALYKKALNNSEVEIY